jgi:hypothetical protein
MARRDSLEDFLRRKHEAAEEGDRVDWPARVQKWQRAISELYSQIEAWLLPSINAHHVELVRTPVRLNEERIGSYDTDSLAIVVGPERVYLEPRGTLIVGASGRVDVRGSNGEAMLVLDAEWHWNIGRRDPKPSRLPLSEESFAELLRQVMKP